MSWRTRRPAASERLDLHQFTVVGCIIIVIVAAGESAGSALASWDSNCP